MNAPFAPTEKSGAPVKVRFTVDDFYRMDQVGVFDRFARTELIDGELFAVNALHMPHSRLHKTIYDELNASTKRWNVLETFYATTTELGDNDAPMPDIIVLDRAMAANARRGIPRDAVRLLVEVSVSTSRYDLGRKRALYAKRGIPEYWVALLKKRTIERFVEPVDGEYRQRDSFVFGEAVPSLTLPGIGLDAGLVFD